MRFSNQRAITRQCLGLGLLASHVQHKREVVALQAAMEESRAMFRTIEYGAANLQLLGLNPAVWEDRECSRFLKHELALSVIDHWREEEAIDYAFGRSGYALEFAGDALAFLECKSADEFVMLAATRLSIYPDDELADFVFKLTEAEFKAFDTFISEASLPVPDSGG